jgi:hypothetical protein
VQVQAVWAGRRAGRQGEVWEGPSLSLLQSAVWMT